MLGLRDATLGLGLGLHGMGVERVRGMICEAN